MVGGVAYEFSGDIELYEDSRMNWRTAFQQTYYQHILDLRRARHAGDIIPRYALHRTWVPKYLTDKDIQDLSWRLAERQVERAIIQHDRNNDPRKGKPRR